MLYKELTQGFTDEQVRALNPYERNLTQKQWAIRHEVTARAYASTSDRRKLSKAEKALTIRSFVLYYEDKYLDGADDGARGRMAEVVLRFEFSKGQSVVLRPQKEGADDVTFYHDGKRQRLEVKTAGGQIADLSNAGLPESPDTIRSHYETCANYDFIVYAPEWDTTASPLIDAVVFTKKAFFEWLDSWESSRSKGIASITRILDGNRVMIQDPKVGLSKAQAQGKSTPRWEFFQSIYDAIDDTSAWALPDFMEAIGK